MSCRGLDGGWKERPDGYDDDDKAFSQKLISYEKPFKYIESPGLSEEKYNVKKCRKKDIFLSFLPLTRI